jgi:hypothetical protein
MLSTRSSRGPHAGSPRGVLGNYTKSHEATQTNADLRRSASNRPVTLCKATFIASKLCPGSFINPLPAREHLPWMFDTEEIGNLAVVLGIVNYKVGNLAGFE